MVSIGLCRGIETTQALISGRILRFGSKFFVFEIGKAGESGDGKAGTDGTFSVPMKLTRSEFEFRLYNRTVEES